MKNFIVLVLLFFSVVGSISAQPDMLWEHDYQSEKFTFGWFWDLVPTEDGVVAFGNGVTEDVHCWVAVEYDSEGNIIRDNTFPYHWVNPTGIIAINANGGGYIACAQNHVVRFDAELDTVWGVELGHFHHAEMHDVIAIDDGYILVGDLFDTVAHSHDAGIIKLNEDGEEEWRRMLGCWGGINSISQTEDGDIYIGGFGSAIIPGHGYILQIDEAGDSLRFLMGAEAWHLEQMYIENDIIYASGRSLRLYSCRDGELISGYSFQFSNIYPDNTDYSVVDFYWLPEGGGIATGYVALDMNYVEDWPADYHLFVIRYSPDYEPVWHIEQPSNWEFWVGGESVVPGAENSYYFCGQIEGMFYIARTEPDPYSVVHPSSPEPCETFCLNPAYPNPFNSTTSIRYNVPTTCKCELTMLDISGRVLDRMDVAPGNGTFTWTAPQSGVYIIRLASGDRQTARKLVCVE